MALTSLQVCMDSSDWLQGTIHEDQTGMDSSSSPSGDMLTCSSRPLMERRLRPPHDQALKCPRCDSTHTKFCYYNNYSLSQPRYFCKTCRRYWTKGGTLRNIPVGGGCRKNKKVSSNKKGSSNVNDQNPQNLGSPPMILSNDDHNHNHQHHLQLSFPQMGMGFSHHQFGSSMLESPTNNFMFQESHVPMQPPIDFMVGGSRSHDFMGSAFSCEDSISPIGAMHQQHQTPSFHNLCSSAQSPFTMYMDSGNHQQHHSNNHVGGLMLPYEGNDHHQDHGNSGGIMDVKPNAKHLALEWHDPQQNMVGKDHSFDYFNGVGSSSWPGLMNGYGTSAANPLV